MTLEQLTAEVESLKANRQRDAARIRFLEEYVDTVSSPMWLRLIFVIFGYRFRQLGRWYESALMVRIEKRLYRWIRG